MTLIKSLCTRNKSRKLKKKLFLSALNGSYLITPSFRSLFSISWICERNWLNTHQLTERTRTRTWVLTLPTTSPTIKFYTTSSRYRYINKTMFDCFNPDRVKITLLLKIKRKQHHNLYIKIVYKHNMKCEKVHAWRGREGVMY